MLSAEGSNGIKGIKLNESKTTCKVNNKEKLFLKTCIYRIQNFYNYKCKLVTCKIAVKNITESFKNL